MQCGTERAKKENLDRILDPKSKQIIASGVLKTEFALAKVLNKDTISLQSKTGKRMEITAPHASDKPFTIPEDVFPQVK